MAMSWRSAAVAASLIAVAGAGLEGAGQSDADRVARGEYLVNNVAMCVQCHTPRDERGELERSKLLQGAPVPVVSPYPNDQWAFTAPRIAGLAPWTKEQLVTLLTTGARATGERPKPPIPPFRMTREDTEAVVAYLRSLR